MGRTLPKLMESKDRSRANLRLLVLYRRSKQVDRILPQVPRGPSLGCSHMDNHKALDVGELWADKVHLQLPWAALGGGYVELDQGLLLRLQAGHP